MFRLLTLTVSAFLIPILGVSLWQQLSQVQGLGGNVFWFLAGALTAGLVFMWTGPSTIRLVVMHELNHAFVGWLMGARIRAVAASDSTGGQVESEFASWGEEMMALAPYFFQPVALGLAAVTAIAQPAWAPVLCLPMGFAWAGFYFDLWTTLRVPQTDILKTGRGFSFVVLVALNLLVSGVVLTSIVPETSVKGFVWEGPGRLVGEFVETVRQAYERL